MKQFEKLENAIAQHGCRAIARKLVSELLIRKIGLDLDSLADTSDICNEIDEIESLLSEGDYLSALEYSKSVVTEISDNLYEYI